MNPKSETIDAIRRLNGTASPEFLAEFSSDDLASYLERLASTAKRRQTPDRRYETPCTEATSLQRLARDKHA